MEYRKSFALIILIVLSTTFIVGSLFLRKSALNVSAVETTEYMGVYWDKNCSQRVYSINWGVLTPGEEKNVVVYVRNGGNETCRLALTPVNWSPSNASHYLNFSWSCEDSKIGAGEIVKVTQSLLVSPHTTGISNFNFDIIFEGRKYFLGDINKDGVVNIRDVAIVALAYGSTPGDSRWNPDADLNKDGIVDIRDIVLVIEDWGKGYEP